MQLDSRVFSVYPTELKFQHVFRIQAYPINDILTHVANYPWPSVFNPSNDDDDWKYGTPPSHMRRLCDHWQHTYDWRAREADMNKLPHYTASIDGQTMHFIHVRGSGNASTRPPLLPIHGWPYSF
ncbi:hypothetical protein LTS18_001921 [Coniosporium uncinatum]|uniref:Uncharacterized protein n=1 Tax=Coniosporium uncinatum TaxID=93489 RepID=A0ACC3DUL8_9PEZI|nr:hypothetical protein LTS18_001921 [Coniosporium uncinatum]